MSEEKEYTVDPKSIKELVTSDAAKRQFAMALPKHLTVDRFLRVALTAFNKTPKLQACTGESLTSCLMSCSELGLEPDGRKAHLIPYWNSKAKRFICTLIVDYKGLVDIARRSGEIADIHADVVCENDKFEYSYGTDGHLKHVPTFVDRGEVVAAYSFVRLKDGSSSYEVMNKGEVEGIQKRSKAATSGPWITDWNEMAKKTVFRRHSKWLPVSAEFRDAIDKDYDVPIDIMKPANVVGKPEVEPPKSLSDKDKEEDKPDPQPEAKKTDKDEKAKAKTKTSKETKSTKSEPKKEEKADSEYVKMLKDFQDVKKQVGEKVYYKVLGENGLEKSNQIRTIKEGGRIMTEMLKVGEDSKEEREPGSEG